MKHIKKFLPRKMSRKQLGYSLFVQYQYFFYLTRLKTDLVSNIFSFNFPKTFFKYKIKIF